MQVAMFTQGSVPPPPSLTPSALLLPMDAQEKGNLMPHLERLAPCIEPVHCHILEGVHTRDSPLPSPPGLSLK